jgi:hypothetical protein
MMKLGIIGSELMMKLGIINSEDLQHLRRHQSRRVQVKGKSKTGDE